MMYAKKVSVAAFMWTIIGSRSRLHHQSIQAINIVAPNATHTQTENTTKISMKR